MDIGGNPVFILVVRASVDITHIEFSLLINCRGPGYSALRRLLAHQHFNRAGLWQLAVKPVEKLRRGGSD